MNKFFVSLATAFFALTLLFSGAGSAPAQRAPTGTLTQDSRDSFANDRRPFDFSDGYYQTNGIQAAFLIDRRNGADGRSVFDVVNDRRFNGVRITETLPAYSGEGSPIFWNYYAGFYRDAFTADEAGGNAVTAAYAYPLYVFPSMRVENTDRQAAMIPIDASYATRNPLGLAAVFLVEYTEEIFTKSGQVALEMLAERNGLSVDGTPIIRTLRELDELVSARLVTVRHADSSGRAPFAVAKVLESPELGSITPDAFLVFVKQQAGQDDAQPLEAERHFVTKFQCLKTGEAECF